jgi:putative FmdB family regulatory protein
MYEYVCDDCGTSFEKLVRRDDTVACPSCGEDHLQQKYSTFAAKATGDSSGAQYSMGGCPSGMCGNPGGCASNN